MEMEVMSKKQTFEDALKKLQNIIEELESGSPTLDKMMQLFEDGMNLMQECRTHLTEVEERINTLIKTSEDYNKMKGETGCDGVMIGRAALGKPWIFNSIKMKSSEKFIIDPDIVQIINISRRHFVMLTEYYNNNLSVNLAKKHFNYYFKGFAGASLWRKQFMQIKNTDDIFFLLEKMEKALASNFY